MLFSQISRTDSSPKLGGECEYTFIDRSFRHEITRVRNILEDLFSSYPREAAGELASRVQSKNDGLFNSAIFELLIFSMLTKLGYRLVPHPVLNNGSSKRPDFLVVAQSGAEFYLEAVLASEEDGTLVGRNRMIETTLDAIRKARHDNFWVDFTHSGLPNSQPPGSKLVRDVLVWLDSLDADVVSEQLSAGIHRPEHNLVRRYGGWSISLRPRPISRRTRGKSKSLIGISSKGIGFVDSSSPIRDAIRSKGNWYGELDKPYVIAVNFNTPFLDDSDEVDALFGTEQVVIANEESEPTFERLERKPDGAWVSRSGPQYKRVSGAWIFNDLNAYSIASRHATLYFNPWATKPLPAELNDLPHAKVENDRLIRQSGVSIREIFDLPERWPED